MAEQYPSSLALTTAVNNEEKQYDRTLCIICQENDSSTRLSTGITGRQSVKRAAELREDNVKKRIKNYHSDTNNTDSSDNSIFFYHNNNKCFKTYINSKTVKIFEDKSNQGVSHCDQKKDSSIPKARTSQRKSIVPCAPPSCKESPKNCPCMLCGQVKYKGTRDKNKLCEYESAKKFIQAIKYNQDNVFIRVADRLTDDEAQCIDSLLSADLYYHRVCGKSYLAKYNRDSSKSNENPTMKDHQLKQVLFNRAVPYFDSLIENGECCTIKDAVDFTVSLLEEGEVLKGTLYNYDMKRFLISHYSDTITVAPNTRQYESDIFFSASISLADIAVKLKNLDVMKEAGIQFRKALMEVDFGLQDSFCDSIDLQESWEKTRIPTSVLTFLSVVYNVPKHKLFRASYKDLETVINPSQEEDITSDDDEESMQSQDQCEKVEFGEIEWIRDHKSTQLHCLFQILVHSIHNGSQRTPMHMMLGHSIYARSRSRQLITAFNRIGACSSYCTIKSARKILGDYAINCSEKEDTPMPSNLNKEDFTQGGSDNSDYSDRSSISGMHGNHYAAMVLFQDATNPPLRKPPISATNIKYSESLKKRELPCQTVPPYNKPVIRPSIPTSMILHPENCQLEQLDMIGARTISKKREFAISLVRRGSAVEDPLTWQGFHILVSASAVPLKRVGFLPVIPKPITDHATVRHVITSFQNVRKQLNQTVMPVWVDEKVYEYMVDICLSEPDSFKDILPCMGPFHWTRVLLKCQGKYIRGSGPDDALIECSVFGRGVLETVLNGSHYVRSLTGMLIIEDMVISLIWEEFWKHHDKSQYPVLIQAEDLQKKLTIKDRCSVEFNTLVDQVDDLMEDFTKFQKQCEEKSELCKYLGVWLKLVEVIKNAVVSEREGNWDLHVAMVEDSQALFTEMDSYNYLRYGSYYLETIKVLEFTHPEIYRRFAMGSWVMQENPGWFKAVGGDMKVEQTIQRVSKGPGGHFVVGETRKATAVADFELLYFEIGSICNVLNIIIKDQSFVHTECHVPRALSNSRRITINQNVAKLLDFIKKHKNPYSVSSTIFIPLHHWITGLRVDKVVASRLLKVIENGEKAYKDYRNVRFVEKTKKISARISKQNLPSFSYQPQKEHPHIIEKQNLSSKCIAEAQRNIEIIKERGMDLATIFSYDLLPISPLFNGDLPAATIKSKLVAEIETGLNLDQWDQNTNLSTHVVVDFMSKIRQMPLDKCLTLGEAIERVITSAILVSRDVDFVHFVFDSYIELSLKEGERLRRYNPIEGIEMIGMHKDSPVPRQVDKFWACETNKQNIQLLCRDIVSCRTQSHLSLVTSSVVIDSEIYPAISTGREIPELLSLIEEGEAHCILHIDWTIRVKKAERVIVMSNDTDMFALLINFVPFFLSQGVKEIWQQYGKGETRRMLPLHQTLSKLGPLKAKSVIKAHILTGDDCMSKIGTKHAALFFNPDRYLTNFGENIELSDQDKALAEEFLVKVWSGVRSLTTCKTFDELRVEKYKGGTGIDSLPPTSSVVQGHILRGALLVYRAGHLLDGDPDELNLNLYGWEENFGIMLPSKCLNLIPDNMLNLCKCTGKCDSRKCRCIAGDVKCTTFCHGKLNNMLCKNQL